MKPLFFRVLVLFLAVQTALFSQSAGEASPEQKLEYTNPGCYEPVSIHETDLVQSRDVKNVILMIGDGMGVAQIFAGMTANRGRLNLEYLKTIGFSKTQSFDNYTTDSGAGGTAIATGTKTRNMTIGLDSKGNPVQTIIELAELGGLSTGLIATSTITHPTPASFAAHQVSRFMEDAIALDLVDSGVDVLIGGGRKYFTARSDNRNLLDTLKQKGYIIHESLASLEESPSAPMIALLDSNALPPFHLRGDMVPRATQTALQVLSQSGKGFFLMIEGSQIDWGGHDKNPERIVGEMLDFDRTLGVVLQFAVQKGNTLIVVTADHETGGVTLKNGSIDEGRVQMAFSTGGHTGVMVPVFAAGPKAELFQGIYENTEIFLKMKQALDL